MHDENDFGFYQGGLSDEDIAALLKLVRAQTDEKILSIVSEKDDAVVTTGILAAPLAGAGMHYDCERTKEGWKIKQASDWIS